MKSSIDPDAFIKPTDTKPEHHRLFRTRLKINKPQYQTIDNLLSNGFIRIETNFDMKSFPKTPSNTPRKNK